MGDPAGEQAHALELLRLAQLTLETLGLELLLVVLVGLDRQADEVGEGPREVHLVGGPGAGFAAVLVADDADHLPADPDRRVEHRRDREGLEVDVAELRGPRVVARVDRGDRPLVLERREVARGRDSGEVEVVRVLAGAPVEEIDAGHVGAALIVEPHPTAHDLKGGGRGLGDLAQGAVEIALGPADSLRQGDEEARLYVAPIELGRGVSVGHRSPQLILGARPGRSAVDLHGPEGPSREVNSRPLQKDGPEQC